MKMNIGHKLITTVARKITQRPDLLDLLDSPNPMGELFSIPNNLLPERVEQYRKAYFGVGNTECYKVNLPNENKLYIKMEYTNSMGNSHYSRFWIVYLFISEILGVINPDETRIIEVTSGSSGIALAMAAEVLNFDVTILVPSCLPESRITPMRRKTTTIIEVEGYIDACIEKLREMINTDDYYATNHSEEKANIITYVFSRIGYEFIRDYGTPDYAILAFGNGSSTEAIARVFKEAKVDSKIFAYRPDFDKHPDEIVFGLLAANIELRHVPVAMEHVDELKYTTGIDLDTVRTRFLDDTEISNLGPSSLYGIDFALELAEEVKGQRILTIGYDKNDRY